MATGNMKWFNQALLDLGLKKHNLATDDLRMAIVTSAVVPSQTTAVPHVGGTGTTNFATTQVAVAGTVYTAPIILTGESWTLVGGVPTLRADVITLAIDAAGFTNGAWGIVYNNTDANKSAIGYVELSAGGSLSLVNGQVVIDWNGSTNDLLTLTGA